MKLVYTISIITFIGFLNSRCAATQDMILLQMSDQYLFHGELHRDRLIPDWMSPRLNPENFRGYEVFVRLWAHHIPFHRSDSLTSYTPVRPNRDAAANLPRTVKLSIGYDHYANKEPFVLYNPAIIPVWNVDRLFITIPGTPLVYQTVLEITHNLTPPPFFGRGPAEKRLIETPQKIWTSHTTPAAHMDARSNTKRSRAE